MWSPANCAPSPDSFLPQLGLAAEKRDTFTRLLGHSMKGTGRGAMSFQQLAIELEKLFHSGQTVQAIQRCHDAASLVPDDADAAKAINAVEAYRKVLHASLANPLSNQIASAAIRHLHPGSPQDYASHAFQSLAGIKTQVPTAKLEQMLGSSGLGAKSKPKPPPPESRLPFGMAHSSGTRKQTVRWHLWRAMPTAELWQAVALSVDIEPVDALRDEARREKRDPSPFARLPQEFFDRLMVCKANLSVNGPIRPQPPLYSGMLGPTCKVLVAEAVAFLAQAQFPLPPEMRALASAKSPAANDATEPQPAPMKGEDYPAGKVWTDERKAEARAYRDKHGLKMTAEHYGVSQATISKHIPAGKPIAKSLGPWAGLDKK